MRAVGSDEGERDNIEVTRVRAVGNVDIPHTTLGTTSELLAVTIKQIFNDVARGCILFAVT